MMSFNFLPVYLAFMNYINLPLQRAVLTAVLRCNFSSLFIFVGIVLTYQHTSILLSEDLWKMSSIRVTGLGTTTLEDDLKVYFSKPEHGGGPIDKIFLPLMNNDAVIVFRESHGNMFCHCWFTCSYNTFSKGVLVQLKIKISYWCLKFKLSMGWILSWLKTWIFSPLPY